MIHRDIKPGNILVDRTGVAKLLDMGLARFYQDEQDQLTLKYDDKNVLGTADYVAPEQTRDSRNIDIRADIYGMGATFYFVLAGRPPFPEATMAEKLIAHQSKMPTPLRDIRSEISTGVARIIDKMMAKDPKDRFQTPQDVVDALEVWTQEPIDPPTADEMPRLSPAAMESGYATKPGAPSAPELVVPSREPAPPRAKEQVPARPAPTRSQIPEPDDRDIEEGVTVPVPPSMRPAFAARKPTGSESEIDLVAMFGQPTIRPTRPRPRRGRSALASRRRRPEACVR